MITTPRTWIEATTIGDLVDRRAHEDPDGESIVFPDRRLTFGDMAAASDRMAKGLIAAGVEHGDRVGYMLHDCPEALAIIYGAAKVGALAVPINNRFKAFELRTVIGHAGIRVLVTAPTQSGPGATDFLTLLGDLIEGEDYPDLTTLVVLGDTPSGAFQAQTDFEAAGDAIDDATLRQRAAAVRIRDAALVVYTSGTTAAPKGALISHEAFCRYGQGTVQRMALTDEDRIWTVLPLFHIGGIAFAIGSLYGGCAYVHSGRFDPTAVVAQLVAERCTIALPGFETIWLPVIGHDDFDAEATALRIVLCVGVPERLRKVQAAHPDASVVNCFGQTEACAFLSLALPDDALEQRITTGGHPMPGMEVRAVDPVTGQTVEPGELGEICYRGPNAFDGYFRDPDRTAEVFDDLGFFHTGDMGTVDAEGRVTFVSRLKDMLKVGGENVAAAEVEGFLIGHPAVAMVNVVAAPDTRYGEVPAAFVQLAPGAALTEEELVEFCRGQIATFRVPRYVRFVDEWPMSGTKVKKYVLRERIADELTSRGIREAPKITSGG
ncbi:AMP-binding protein [Euzebya tangerina]|uniref:AMP-binding protein n=1 Tax=Euzebya tangerina TaxID=591198 RepID=UPI000E31F9E0|nr:AMP-binding protein [Euzebya tangerina]